MELRFSLKKKLSVGKTVLGTWCEIPSAEFINVMAKAGLDFVIIDMEHGAMTYETAGQMVLSAEVEGCSSIIRVPQNSESAILRALELKPEGVIVPHIERASDRQKVIDSIKFPPVGNRSLNPYVRAGGYKSKLNFTREENARTLSAILVESKEGIKNIGSILDDKNLDLVYLGSYDISVALNCPGETGNPKVIDILKRLTKKVTDKNKVTGTMFHNKEEFKLFKSFGIKFLCYKVDTSIVFDEIEKIRRLV